MNDWIKAFVLANLTIILCALFVLAIVHYPLQVLIVIAIAFLTPLIYSYRDTMRKQARADEQLASIRDEFKDKYKSWPDSDDKRID